MSIEEGIDISDENKLLNTIFYLASDGLEYLYYYEQIISYQQKIPSNYSWYWSNVKSAYLKLMALNWCMLYCEREESSYIKIIKYDKIIIALKKFYQINDDEPIKSVVKQKFISNIMEKHKCVEAEYIFKMKTYRDKYISHKDNDREPFFIIPNLRVCQDMFEHVLELANFFRENYDSLFHTPKRDDSKFIMFDYKNLNEMIEKIPHMSKQKDLLEQISKPQ